MNDIPDALGPYVIGFSTYAMDRDHEAENPYAPGCAAYDAYRAGWLKAEKDSLEKPSSEL